MSATLIVFAVNWPPHAPAPGHALSSSTASRADDIVLPHSPPLADLLASIVAGGRVTLCTQCAARRDIGPGDVIEGIQIGGAATFVSEVTADGTQALVY